MNQTTVVKSVAYLARNF